MIGARRVGRIGAGTTITTYVNWLMQRANLDRKLIVGHALIQRLRLSSYFRPMNIFSPRLSR